MEIKLIKKKQPSKFWCLQLAPLCLSFAETIDKDVDTKLLTCFIRTYLDHLRTIKSKKVIAYSWTVGEI